MAVSETVAAPARHRFSVAEYYALAATGILDPEQRTELVDGVVYDMTPIGPRHGFSVDEAAEQFKDRLGRRVRLRVQSPLRLDDEGEPEPDLVLLRPRADRYRGRVPTAADALLVVEVSDTTLAHDRLRKVPAYARAGVPEVWIVNLVDGVVETWFDPAGGAYRGQRTYRRGASLAPRAFPDCQLAVDEIIG